MDLAPLLEQHRAHATDLARIKAALLALLPGDILFSGTKIIPASGVAELEFRKPYRAVHADNRSALPVTLSAAPPAQTAPTSGPGVAPVAAGCAKTINMEGCSLSVYGNPGDQVVLTVCDRPWTPAAAVTGGVPAGAAFRDSVPTVQATQARTTPTAGQVVATITPGAGIWEISGLLMISGTTVAAADSNNMALNQTATPRLSPLLIIVPGTTGLTAPVPLPATVLSLSAAADTVNVTAIALATTGAVYTVTLIARRIG